MTVSNSLAVSAVSEVSLAVSAFATISGFKLVRSLSSLCCLCSLSSLCSLCNQCCLCSLAMPPTWVKPDWKDDDIFEFTPAELDVLKQRVAVIGKIKFRRAGQGSFGLPVSGAPALEEAPFKMKATEYLTLMNTNHGDRSPDWAAQVFVFCVAMVCRFVLPRQFAFCLPHPALPRSPLHLRHTMVKHL